MLIQLLISLFWACMPGPQISNRESRYAEILSALPKDALVSITIQYAGSGDLIFERNSSTPLRPASNMKIFTTASSLFLLGKDFSPSAGIYFDRNKTAGGTLKDNLYFKGKGAASLNIEEIYSLAERLKKEGITRIEGNLVYDNSYFPSAPPSKEFSYSPTPIDRPAVSPISLNRNIILLKHEGRNGYSAIPKTDFITVRNSSRNFIDETAGGYTVYYSGSAARDITYYIKKPALFASLMLKQILGEKGISVTGRCIEGKCPAGLASIEYKEPISQFLNESNKRSDNFSAEMLRQITEAEYRIRFNRNFLPAEYLKEKGVFTEKLLSADGSGISRNNRASSKTIASLLGIIFNSREIFPVFFNSLSAAGIDGTLKERFAGSVLKENFRGKSGWLAGISSLSGYVKTKNGKSVIVSIIINDTTRGIGYYNKIEEKILEEICQKQ